ncbi:MAG: hypothetical protein A2096_14220 [Spirochaetes bacterium GWF1_41_5]|nr:MAG: hypothetical protein A2096_14220 [Spirochaetes bacterium GWF1_41_5]HBE04578.1 ATPase [Spirochaetia bacterium]
MNKVKVVKRFFHAPQKQSYFLFGPHGTGKSLFLKFYYPKAKFIDLLDDAVQFEYTRNPENLKHLLAAMRDNDVLIIDEVQKAPNLLSSIHKMMEDQSLPRVQYVLTGSSARKLKAGGADLLGGRALVKTMHPFMASELESAFDLKHALKNGLLPVIFNSDDPKNALAAYINVYLQQEVRQEGIVRNLSAFTRFLEAMSYSHAEILNLANISRECQVKRSTLDSYYEILEDLLLGFSIRSFKKNNRKSTVESSKFYFFDSGVFKALRPAGPLDDPDHAEGSALEGLVAQHLRAWAQYMDQGSEIYFWRTRAGNEVDFIIYGPENFIAIEVKKNSTIHPSDLSGLKSFKEDYPTSICVLLYGGSNIEKRGDILCLPLESFLPELTPENNMNFIKKYFQAQAGRI